MMNRRNIILGTIAAALIPQVAQASTMRPRIHLRRVSQPHLVCNIPIRSGWSLTVQFDERGEASFEDQNLQVLQVTTADIARGITKAYPRYRVISLTNKIILWEIVHDNT